MSCAKGKNIDFRHFWRPFWIFAENRKVSISQTVRDRAISSKFLTCRVVQESPVQRGKISIFATFGGHLRFLRKMKKCQYLENRKRSSDFERIFDPQGDTRVSCPKGKNFIFRHFRRPSWIFAENGKVSISRKA